MRYYFYKGPVNLKERFPDLVNNSFYTHLVTETSYYVNLPGVGKVDVFRMEETWKSTSVNREVDEYIQENQPQVFSEERVFEESWVPNFKAKDNGWLSIMVEKGKIIGSYAGRLYTDKLGRRYSAQSFITISPEYHGTGLCREFATFTYERLLSIYQVDYIAIFVSSTIGAGACRCYIRAAKDLDLYVFGAFDHPNTFLIREIEDCNKGNLEELIFTFLPTIDENMLDYFTAT
ncbi:Acyl-CoA N-acetyltransferase [Cedratvirus Zaza IHUMI]|uniref:Acyl-CoA N-acetyltransferase n=1 Tax=Cedratvirus Zaza IHUMI TaxID=2126979 RepID=A0A2R8FDI2_9VIRU|nr:Acyl-CoA N-acetyltransferase [Cedratvirus Zaza IHUMI]